MKKNNFLWLFIILLFFWLFFYFKNLSNTPFGGDSSELVSAMVSWGIAHPPGYPLLMLLGNVFVRIFPFLNIYEKLSLLSAIFVFFTSLIIFFTLRLIIRNFSVSFFLSLFYLTLFPVWLYGLVPEVFALANFLIISQIYLLLRLYLDKRNNFYLFLFSFLIGLSIAHHHLFVIFLPSYLYLINKNKPLKDFFLQNKIKTFFGLILGVSFYLYPPIVSFFGTSLDIENAKTLTGFLRLITRASYGTFTAYVGSGGNFFNRLFDSLSILIFLLHDFKPLGLIFIILGGWYFLKKRQKTLFNFFLIQVVGLILFFFYTNFALGGSFGVATYERFLTFFYLPLIIFFAGGFILAFTIIVQLIKKFSEKKIILFLPKLMLWILICFLSFNNIIKNEPVLKTLKNNQSFANLGKDILKSLPKNALFLGQSDHSYFLAENQQIVYQFRNDITIVPLIIDREYIRNRLKKKMPKILFPKKITLKSFLEENYQQGIKSFSDQPMNFGFWAPYGILWKYYPKIEDYQKEKEKIIEINKKLWRSYQIPKIAGLEKNILFLNDVKEQYFRQHWAYINFLALADQPLTARNEADLHLKDFQNNFKYLISYINLKVVLLECDEKTKKLVEKALGYQINNSEDYLPLLNYYKYCQKNKKKYETLFKKYQKLKEKEDFSLEKI